MPRERGQRAIGEWDCGVNPRRASPRPLAPGRRSRARRVPTQAWLLTSATLTAQDDSILSGEVGIEARIRKLERPLISKPALLYLPQSMPSHTMSACERKWRKRVAWYAQRRSSLLLDDARASQRAGVCPPNGLTTALPLLVQAEHGARYPPKIRGSVSGARRQIIFGRHHIRGTRCSLVVIDKLPFGPRRSSG